MNINKICSFIDRPAAQTCTTLRGNAHRLLGEPDTPQALTEGTSNLFVSNAAAGESATTHHACDVPDVYAMLMHLQHWRCTWASGKAVGGVEHLSLACLAAPNQAEVPVPGMHWVCYRMASDGHHQLAGDRCLQMLKTAHTGGYTLLHSSQHCGL